MRHWARAAGISLFVVGAAAALPRVARAGDGWWGDLDKGQSVRLSDVVAAPESYRGRTITFVCLFHQREHEFNPLRSRFNVERYDNVSVWPDGKAVWLAGDFEQDFPFLYVERTRPQRDEFLRLPVFTRIEVTGRIEAVIDGSPFIEMTSFRPTGHRLGKDVVDMMMRAETYARSGELTAKEIAADNAQAALEDAPDLAPIYAVRIRARLAELLQASGRTADADRVLAGERIGPASPVVPGAPGEQGTPAAFPAANLPGSPIDAGPTPALGNLPGTPVDEPASGSANLPGTRVDQPPTSGKADQLGGFGDKYRDQFQEPCAPPPAPRAVPNDGPAQPFRPSLPGVPLDVPEPPQKPLSKMPAVPPAAPVGKVPAPLPPPQVKTPGAFPAPTPPSAGVPSTPTTFPPPAPPTAPEIVDPPLPAPAPGGKPPARRPRLAGVK